MRIINIRTKRNNIIRACDIAAIAFLVFTILQFADGDALYNIGNRIEESLHIHTEINVETMRAYLVMIFSGIFAITIVALCFYIVEYQCEKQAAIMKLIKENNRLSKLYLELPYIDDKSDYGKLCINYYYEVLGELIERKRDKDLAHIIVSESIKESTMKNTYKAKLIKFLKQNKQLLKDVFDDSELLISQKLKDIFVEMHLKLKDALEVYSLVVKEDLEELKYCVYDIGRFSGLSYKKIKKVVGDDEEVLLGLRRASILNISLVEERILTLHERVHQRAKLIFEEIELDSENIKNYLDNYAVCQNLLNKVLDAQNGVFDKVYHKFFEAYFIYYKFSYHMAKLNSILFYDLTRKIDKIDKGEFTSRRKVSVRGGHVLHNKMIPGEVMYGDIYR